MNIGPILPYEICAFPQNLISELDRRRVNRSFNYIPNDKGEWDQLTGEWSTYKGPLSPFIRLCSNGKGKGNGKPFINDYGDIESEDFLKQGFILTGGKDFYTGYGFNDLKGSPSIIGYMPDANNTPHTIDNDMNANYPIHVPPPEIEKISVVIQKELVRKATVEWTCFSKAQLEYMTPYFLVPGITCILEWGWNHFNPTSLLNLSDIKDLKDKFNNPYPLYTENILNSNGNYDVIFGIITHFEWSVEGTKIKCKTEISSKDRIYAGISMDANVETQNGIVPKKGEPPVNSLCNAMNFFGKTFLQFKDILSTKSDVPTGLKTLKSYLESRHKDNWQEYFYGVFYGRTRNTPINIRNTRGLGTAFGGGFQSINSSPEITSLLSPKNVSNLLEEANTDRDFDFKNGGKDLWVNFGLVIEAINLLVAPLTGMAKKEMFRIDIDDVVIGAHPNMISTNSEILLVPNSEAPKYFSGDYGKYSGYEPVQLLDKTYVFNKTRSKDYDPNLDNSTIQSSGPLVDKKQAIDSNRLADFRLAEVCKQTTGVYRDDIDEIINEIRYRSDKMSDIKIRRKYSFPFPPHINESIPDSSKQYPPRYSGYLKDLYINVTYINNVLKDSKDYKMFIIKMLEGIGAACGSFWDFKLVSSTGNSTLSKDDVATMKIVDYKFTATINHGPIYTFDYFDSDSLLLGTSFKPTLSNAQAIRAMYAPVNNPNRINTLVNGNNELLDYHFKDRLFDNGDEIFDDVNIKRSEDEQKSIFKKLQKTTPPDGSCQISNTVNGTKYIRRLAIPNDNASILNLLLEDGDEESNPKYTGIMPGIESTFTIQGIGGLRTFMAFLVRNLPEPYSHKNIIFRINNVQESIEAGKWTTTITAGLIPLRKHIKDRFGIKF